MSTQKGNAHRSRPQKHKNIKSFRNDLHDTSHLTKKLNNLEFYGICHRCKDIIDWKVKFKKYKTLTTAKKCVKCLEKKVKHAYYIVCQECCETHKICSKCSKPSEQLEFAESEVDRRRKEDQFQQELKQLSERQRRKFLRLLEKGLLTKENVAEEVGKIKKDDMDDDDLDDFDDDEELDDLIDSPKKKVDKIQKQSQVETRKNAGDEENDSGEEFDEDDDEDYDDDDDDDDDEEEE